MANLLTRTRRQGWTLNHGTRRQPRWATARLMKVTITDIADALNLERPVFDPRDPVPVEFLRSAARSVGLVADSDREAKIGQAIVESAGGTWKPEFDSASSSVTGAGLQAIQEAVGFLMTPDDQISTM